MKKRFSIKAKIALLLIVSSLIMIISILSAARIVTQQNVEEICENYLYDACISASDTLYESFWGDNERTDMSVRLQFILNGVGIEGVRSSEAILVDKDGTILYNNDSKLVGTKMESNPVIEKVLEKVNAGSIMTADVESCEINGVDKYVAFMCTVNNWVLYVQADKDEVLEPIDTMNSFCMMVGAVVLVVALVVGLVITDIITRPIKAMTKIINAISNLDLRAEHKIPKTHDEIGEMGTAVETMRESLSSIVQDINYVAHSLVEDSNVLYEISEKVSEASANNSATTEELAAGMQETSSSTDVVNENIAEVRININNVVKKIEDGTRIAGKTMDTADKINVRTQQSNENTMQIYDEIKVLSEEAFEKSKAVSKVQELSAVIQEIAEQTNLLSLNATIEAARAGEAGKGFAVVANEVGNLAIQSSDTAQMITEIVEQVNESVRDLLNCLQKCLEFLDKDVQADYKTFIESSTEFNEETENIVNFMEEANKEVDMLQITVGTIADAMEAINITMNEASTGVVDIASKTGDVENLAKELYEKTQNCKEFANKLNDITERFKS